MKYTDAEMKIEQFHDYDFMTNSQILTDPITQSTAPANTEEGYGPLH